MTIEILILIFAVSFLLEYFDAGVGMGYGEIAALLLLLGIAVHEAVFAVLVTGMILNLFSAGLHHTFKNVDFNWGSKELKIAATLMGFGVLGVLIGVGVALTLPPIILKMYIGLLIIGMGIRILVHKRKGKFSWKRLMGFGALAAFNKGMSGGGYGPIITSGQIDSGVESKKAVGITSLAEAVVSLTAIIVYFFIDGRVYIDIPLFGALLLGGLIAVPVATHTVRLISARRLKTATGDVSIILGALVLVQIFV